MSKLPKFGRELRQINLFLLGSVLALAGAGPLASCSSIGPIGSEMPTAMGGLPQGTPARQETPPAFPAVHDMPPPRNSVVLTDEEKKRLEAELAVARAEQARRAALSATKPE
jgi:hypothetical protein